MVTLKNGLVFNIEIIEIIGVIEVKRCLKNTLEA